MCTWMKKFLSIRIVTCLQFHFFESNCLERHNKSPGLAYASLRRRIDVFALLSPADTAGLGIGLVIWILDSNRRGNRPTQGRNRIINCEHSSHPSLSGSIPSAMIIVFLTIWWQATCAPVGFVVDTGIIHVDFYFSKRGPQHFWRVFFSRRSGRSTRIEPLRGKAAGPATWRCRRARVLRHSCYAVSRESFPLNGRPCARQSEYSDSQWRR